MAVGSNGNQYNTIHWWLVGVSFEIDAYIFG